MRTRMVYTKVWKDEYFGSLNRVEKLLFIYLLTNDKANICGVYELSDREIKFDLDITEPELQDAKSHLQRDGKFIFQNSWVRAVNYDKYNQYTGARNDVAKESELKLCPKELIEYPIDRVSGFSDSLTNHNHNHNHKSNTKNIKESAKVDYLKSDSCYQELYKTFPRTDERAIRSKCEEFYDYCISNGKNYKDYLAAVRGAVRRDQDKMQKKIAPSVIADRKELTQEEREKNIGRLRKMKEGIG